MDKNKKGKNSNNNLNADNSSASFDESNFFSINRFLESLGGSKIKEEDNNYNEINKPTNNLVELSEDKAQKEDELKGNSLNENNVKEISNDNFNNENNEIESKDKLEQKNDLEPRMQYAINKFSGKTWFRKKQEEKVDLNSENNLDIDNKVNETNNDYRNDLMQDENNLDSNLINSSATENDNINNSVKNDDNKTEFDDFEAFLNSLSSSSEPIKTEPNKSVEQSAQMDNEPITSIENKQNLNENNENKLEIKEEDNTQTQSKNAEDTNHESEPKTKRKSISKLDYFKFRFLSNSAVGSDGKAKVEQLATRYGNNRKDNAGVISSDQSADVQVHYSGDFKQNEINLDFSKKGSVKVYRNSKLLSILCSVFAVIYAIVGFTLFLIIGRIPTEPVVAQSIEMNYSGVIYQEIGTKLDLTGLKVVTNYSNDKDTVVNLTYSMITNLNSVVDDNYNIIIETNTEPINLEVNLNGFTTSFKLWTFKWEVDDVTVKYFKTSNEIETSEFNNVLCYAVFEKDLGGHIISFKKNIVLSRENCEFTNTSITRVYIPEINTWKVANFVSI